MARAAKSRSRRARINELLRRGIVQEQRQKIELEAAEFFVCESGASRRETKAFQSATIRSISRA